MICARPAADPLLDDRRRIDGVVEDDGHPLLDVFARNPLEFASAFSVKGNGHVWIVELADRDSRIAQDVSGQHDPLFDEVGNAVLTSGVLFHGPFEENLTAFRQLRFCLLDDLRFPVFRNAGGQIELHLVVLIQHFEFEKGGFLNQILRPLGIPNPRQLNDDLLQALPLDKGFRDAELVDTVTNRFQGLVDGRVFDALAFRLSELPGDRVRQSRRSRLR